MSHNSHSISHINRYTTVVDEEKVKVSSLHSVTDNYSISTEQALADEEEQLRIGQLLLEDELRSFDNNIRELSSNLSNHTLTSKDDDDFDNED